jgi:hypothetical protein
MPMFRLVSTAAHEALAVEFCDHNCAGALETAERARLAEADLWQEGTYLFTMRKQGDADGLWAIYRKPGLVNEESALAKEAVTTMQVSEMKH